MSADVSAVAVPDKPRIRSTIPARLDRLGWSPFHTRMVYAAGTAEGIALTAVDNGLRMGVPLLERMGAGRAEAQHAVA